MISYRNTQVQRVLPVTEGDKKTLHYSVLTFLLLVLAGILVYQSGILKRKAAVEPARAPKERLVLYVKGKTGRLEKQAMDVRGGLSESERIDTILGALRSTGSVAGSFTVHDATIDTNGTMYLNLRENPFAPPLSAIDEIRTVYSVVNSLLSNFRPVSRIQFLVQGRTVYSFGGALYAHMPFELNEGLLED